MRTRRTAAVAAILLALAACESAPGSAPGPASGSAPGSAPEEAIGTLEQIAERAVCAPEVQTDAAELRQAKCATDDGTYVLTTFATDRGQREWLNEAKDYGGSYLVGRKWTVSGEAATVERVRLRLGGRVETTEPHGAHPSGTATGPDAGPGTGHH
ncbi:hypothetical protein [Streptomyces sp. NPDC047981]|uniref:hypothetical protein n=1 Tax=Streptomyces sp. NPDC047981 TaxID=3154610 RepID=UPI0034214EAA